MCLLLVVLAGCGNKPVASGNSSSGAGSAATAAPQDTPAAATEGVPSADASHPVVTIEMDNGAVIKAELYPEVAPNTVNNFISLIQKGFYDGTIFHRVIPGFMIQGGDPDGTGTGGPGYSIAGEFNSNGFTNNLLHTEGVLSMARSQDMNSGGSQFFIMAADYPSLDGEYAAFGKVTEGMDAVQEIVNLPRDASDRPEQPPVMKKVTVDTLGVTYPEPQKVQ
ncbi:peptidylprolyl isomerase [Paenibacillus sp. FSL K6-1096]|uniref:peptidylprolyl isomerase n=1 Tax=Paenibacillus sp. FSL K6-1096 TaxID=2921460 RepID=UPI0030EC1F8D